MSLVILYIPFVAAFATLSLSKVDCGHPGPVGLAIHVVARPTLVLRRESMRRCGCVMQKEERFFRACFYR